MLFDIKSNATALFSNARLPHSRSHCHTKSHNGFKVFPVVRTASTSLGLPDTPSTCSSSPSTLPFYFWRWICRLCSTFLHASQLLKDSKSPRDEVDMVKARLLERRPTLILCHHITSSLITAKCMGKSKMCNGTLAAMRTTQDRGGRTILCHED